MRMRGKANALSRSSLLFRNFGRQRRDVDRPLPFGGRSL
jgi:hypothetical protein